MTASQTQFIDLEAMDCEFNLCGLSLSDEFKQPDYYIDMQEETADPEAQQTAQNAANNAQNATAQAQQQNNGQTGQNGQQQPKTLTGDATEYNLPGAKLAYGGTYDSTKMAAAMTSDRAKNGQVVDVTYTTKDAKGNPVTTTIHVTVNDTGPFARGDNGKALHPLRPDPKIVIDLTPTAMKALTGSEHNRVPVTVTVPQP